MLDLRTRSCDHRARAALLPGARLRVHSVFERALNLLDQQGRLFGVLGPRGGNGPGLVVLQDLPLGGFDRLGIAIGESTRVDPRRRLIVGDRLRVALDGATVWRRPSTSGRLDRAHLERNTALAAALGFDRRGRDGLGGLLPHVGRLLAGAEPPAAASLLLIVAWRALGALLPAWRRGDAPATAAAATRLVGLGPGQTPSGDDLLAGLMVADARIDAATAGRQRAPVRAACAEAARGRTTDLGLARLGYAAEGELDERSELALAALLDGDAAAVEATTRDLLGYGHSSGLDTLVGLIIGLAVAGVDPTEELR